MMRRRTSGRNVAQPAISSSVRPQPVHRPEAGSTTQTLMHGLSMTAAICPSCPALVRRFADLAKRCALKPTLRNLRNRLQIGNETTFTLPITFSLTGRIAALRRRAGAKGGLADAGSAWRGGGCWISRQSRCRRQLGQGAVLRGPMALATERLQAAASPAARAGAAARRSPQCLSEAPSAARSCRRATRPGFGRSAGRGRCRLRPS